uniref:Lytic transglycosylase n=1 Tax=Pectobacterium carotovorum TaxID=554 RepID=A0A0N7FVZ9_PECCA|nr:transglycosylase SLT domain-containing protein [Pectobacterium carotovorum]ALG88567.1 lytic transglycosylase [Pectobacterium carotovorum]
MRLIIMLLLFCISLSVKASDCFDMAGRDYKIDPDLLRAIAFRESSFTPHAINYVSDKSYALGGMQIHSQNFSHLAQYGITPNLLLSDPCLNIYTGAYYLAVAFKRSGVTWDAVGAYNAGFSDEKKQKIKRLKYASEVHKIYNKIKSNNLMQN